MKRPFTSVLIVAAGKSSRMTETKDKMLALTGGRYVIERTVEAFEQAVTADEIIIIASALNIDTIKSIVRENEFTKVKTTVTGGNSRAESVRNGLAAVSDECRYLSIHDGARPFITPAEIDRLHTEAYKKKALCCGLRLHDTVKRIGADSTVEATVDRNGLVAVQTPQIFERQLYENAVSAAGDDLSLYTDDCSVAEAAGYKVYFSEGSVFNIKITTDKDLRTGEMILKYRENLTV